MSDTAEGSARRLKVATGVSHKGGPGARQSCHSGVAHTCAEETGGRKWEKEFKQLFQGVLLSEESLLAVLVPRIRVLSLR